MPLNHSLNLASTLITLFGRPMTPRPCTPASMSSTCSAAISFICSFTSSCHSWFSSLSSALHFNESFMSKMHHHILSYIYFTKIPLYALIHFLVWWNVSSLGDDWCFIEVLSMKTYKPPHSLVVVNIKSKENNTSFFFFFFFLLPLTPNSQKPPPNVKNLNFL